MGCFIGKSLYYIKKNCVELGSGTGNNLDFLLKFGFNKIYSIEAARSAYQFQKKKFLTKKKIKLFCKDLNSFQFKIRVS